MIQKYWRIIFVTICAAIIGTSAKANSASELAGENCSESVRRNLNQFNFAQNALGRLESPAVLRELEPLYKEEAAALQPEITRLLPPDLQVRIERFVQDRARQGGGALAASNALLNAELAEINQVLRGINASESRGRALDSSVIRGFSLEIHNQSVHLVMQTDIHNRFSPNPRLQSLLEAIGGNQLGGLQAQLRMRIEAPGTAGTGQLNRLEQYRDSALFFLVIREAQSLQTVAISQLRDETQRLGQQVISPECQAAMIQNGYPAVVLAGHSPLRIIDLHHTQAAIQQFLNPSVQPIVAPLAPVQAPPAFRSGTPEPGIGQPAISGFRRN